MTGGVLGAFLLGAASGLIPGPILAAIFAEVLQSNFLRGLRIILWAACTEAAMALASLLALSAFGFSEAWFRGLSFAGAAILAWMAASLWKVGALGGPAERRLGLAQISLMMLANGGLWIFWVTACVPKAVLLGERMRYGELAFIAALEAGWICAAIALACAVSFFRAALSRPNVLPLVFKAVSLVFAGFALEMTIGSLLFFYNSN